MTLGRGYQTAECLVILTVMLTVLECRLGLSGVFIVPLVSMTGSQMTVFPKGGILQNLYSAVRIRPSPPSF
jgi:hypothetical protein